MTRTSDDETSAPAPRLTRRRALGGAATVGLTLPLLSACSDDAAPSAAPSTSSASATTSDSSSSPGPEPSSEPTSEPGTEALASTDDIPVGGGVVYTDSRVVVTQPEAGEFRCFSAVCTHSGCLVAGVSTSINCTCHASSFDLATGEVLGGPAPAPLPAVAFTIDKDQVVLS
ncbi:Rieske (2Fe-2S) protein [Nocardioides sp.]|uniref:Rieske (2Fe-2S) protein n=1 Tax=Nocardioides sp. TaxID=35761 RepID=UPI002B272FBD|nr:Rieske (2Fe-2S) protein [Nocardioides sp.]